MGIEVDDRVGNPTDEFLEVCDLANADSKLKEDAWKSYRTVCEQCTLEVSMHSVY